MASFWKSPAEIYEITLDNAGDSEGKRAKANIYECEREIQHLTADWDHSERMRLKHYPDLSDEDRAYIAAERETFEVRVANLRQRIENARAGVFQLMMANAVKGSWFAVGHRAAEKGEEVIPCRYWPFLTLDMTNDAAKGEQGEYRAIRCAFWKDVPADNPLRATVLQANRQPTHTVGPKERIPTRRSSRAVQTRGPKPAVTERVKDAMRVFGVDNIKGMKQIAMAEQFGASRETCVKALQELLSEF
ncbi:hypothetical protein X773_01210 [Mesorhizobium sp. LSJC285A00]|uniref:hypothetical protein n=1 Tax=Mesorhizobium sp. LSJC285A00 TaxID=1287338 RepID=UPI0003CE1ADB|nr:hypothetical protein [Mesorhizobium sp. LSJC285A00]ESW91725.1 hypothetical protein X773_01210 [Mesorhizobium sp. LSJC285A00]